MPRQLRNQQQGRPRLSMPVIPLTHGQVPQGSRSAPPMPEPTEVTIGQAATLLNVRMPEPTEVTTGQAGTLLNSARVLRTDACVSGLLRTITCWLTRMVNGPCLLSEDTVPGRLPLLGPHVCAGFQLKMLPRFDGSS